MSDLERFTEYLQTLTGAQTDLSESLDIAAFSPEWQPAVAAMHAFLRQVADTLTTLDLAVGKMGTKDALQVLQLRRLVTILDQQNSNLQRLGSNVDELAQGVTTVAEDVHQAAEATGRMARTGGESLEKMQLVLASFQDVDAGAVAARDSVESLVQQSRTVGQGLREIRGVASTSQLLALNAAIQAAHASDKAFAVVAQEMRQLSDKTTALVKQIEGQVGAMESVAGSALTAVRALSDMAIRAGADSRSVAAGVSEIQGLIQETTSSVQSIAAVAEEQAAATEVLSDSGQTLLAQAAAAAESLNLTRNMEISDVSEQAHSALGRFRIGSHNDAMRAMVSEMALRVEESLERLVSDRVVSLDQLWDTGYQKIWGADIQLLARLFNVSRVPAEGFTPPKYRTAYDHLVDGPLNGIMDQYFGKTSLVFATVLDLNGFALAQPKALMQDWTGNAEEDLRNNRVKRLVTDPVSRKACRVALPPQLQDKAIISQADLSRTPLESYGGAATRPFLLQTYALDTGAVVLALAMPVYVQGQRWGTVRIGYRPGESS
ncbi:MAG TPA: methyl-accepting chemotaxis protein [Symbiobacteriaceae bacterium]|nr:methyl-accepting chemotaxis protein [Symbiobacteriaceae bacterium]